MFLLLLTAFVVTGLVSAFGNRRLVGHACNHAVYILAEGAPTVLPGRSFAADRQQWFDARIDDTGIGTALLAGLPECMRANAVSIKVTDPRRLFEAVAYIDSRCVAAQCLVLTKFTGVHGRFRVE